MNGLGQEGKQSLELCGPTSPAELKILKSQNLLQLPAPIGFEILKFLKDITSGQAQCLGENHFKQEAHGP